MSSEAKRTQMLRELQETIAIFRDNGVTPHEVVAALVSMLPELAWEHVKDHPDTRPPISSNFAGHDVDLRRVHRALQFVQGAVGNAFAYNLEEGGFEQ